MRHADRLRGAGTDGARRAREPRGDVRLLRHGHVTAVPASPRPRRPERHAKDDVMVTPTPGAAATARLRAEELGARAATRAATAPIAAPSPFTQPDPSNGDQP